jgi:transposase
MRRCDSLKATRIQQINRQKSGMASSAVNASIAVHVEWLDQQIDAIMVEVQAVVAVDLVLKRIHALLLSIPGIGPVTAPNSAGGGAEHRGVYAKGLAAFAGLSPVEHSSGPTVRRSERISSNEV